MPPIEGAVIILSQVWKQISSLRFFFCFFFLKEQTFMHSLQGNKMNNKNNKNSASDNNWKYNSIKYRNMAPRWRSIE